MFELRGILTCDRCQKSDEMLDVDNEREARQRMSDTDSGWCESDGGEDVCPECWEKFDQQRSAQPASVGAVDRPDGVGTE